MTLFLIFWINFCGLPAHPLYVSMTNMDIDASRKNIVLSVRIFTDDLETVLHNKYDVHGWIGTSGEHPESRRMIGEYINERFSIAVNHSEKLNFVIDSMVIIEDAMWFHIKCRAAQTIRYMEIDNRLLTDFFEQQTNLVIISTGRKEKGYKLNRKNHKIELSL